MNNHQIRQRARILAEKQQTRYAIVTTFLGDIEIASRRVDIASNEDRAWIMRAMIWAVNNNHVVEVAAPETIEAE